MSPAQIAVTLAGVLLAAAVNVYFFAPARPRRARNTDTGGDGRPAMPGDGAPAGS